MNPLALILLTLAGACLPGALLSGGLNGWWVLGVVLVILSLIAQCASQDTEPGDVSRLDEWDGAETHVEPVRDVDLSTLTDTQLEVLRCQQWLDAYDHLGSDEYPEYMAALNRSKAEAERRLERLRAAAGWTWPQEGGRS